jgi:hypothetical protein
LVTIAVEPFIPSGILRPNSDGAWPHSTFGTPLNLYFGWPTQSDDISGIRAIKNVAQVITEAAKKDGQDLASTVLYPNYALGDASIQSVYGANLAKLRALRKQYDPKG